MTKKYSNPLTRFLRDYSHNILPKISVLRQQSEKTPVPDFPEESVFSSEESESLDNSESPDDESNDLSEERTTENREELPDVMATLGVKVEEVSE